MLRLFILSEAVVLLRLQQELAANCLHSPSLKNIKATGRGRKEITTAKSGELCALSWGEAGFGDKVLFDPELQETEQVKLFIPGISNKWDIGLVVGEQQIKINNI